MKSLLETHPRIALRWHPTKNGRLTPKDVSADSEQKVWWQCAGQQHVWRSSVRTRVLSSFRCAVCASLDTKRNTVARKRPDLAAQWHRKRNGDFTPDDVKLTSKAAVWWKCPACPDHEWEVQVNSRTKYKKLGCPFCYGNRTARSNSLATRRGARASLLRKQFHPVNNGELTVDDVQPGTAQELWWLCDEGHAWQASGSDRYRAGRDCPECSEWHAHRAEDIDSLLPELAREWHPTKNKPLRPRDVTRSSTDLVWWRCAKDPSHEWQTQVITRARAKTGCPLCLGRYAAPATSLAALHAALAAQWHPAKNGELTAADLRPGSSRIVWWKCAEGSDHEWQASVCNRTSKRNPTGCPCCAGKKLSVTNRLSTRAPHIASQWHPTKNGALRPREVVAGSHMLAWWKCPNGPDHEWQCKIQTRTAKGGGCPFCAGRLLAFSDSLEARFPGIAREWNSERNAGFTPADLHAGSGQRVWWTCPRHHVWACRVEERTKNGRACPVCAQGV